MRKIIILYIVLFTASISYGQLKNDKHEWGIQGGVMNYMGELSPGMKTSQFHPQFGAFYKHNYNSYFASRYSFTYGQISGADSIWTNNVPRNLHFFSDIYEFSGMLEFNFHRFGFDKFSKKISPFFATGVDVFYFEPMTNYRASEYKLRPYATEGQLLRHNKAYQRVQWALPIGGGIKFHLTKNLVVAVESFWRKTATDFLDDVSGFYPKQSDILKFNDQRKVEDRQMTINLYDRSGEINNDVNLSFEGKQRGNPRNKDWYYTIGLTVSYRVVKYSCKKGGF